MSYLFYVLAIATQAAFIFLDSKHLRYLMDFLSRGEWYVDLSERLIYPMMAVTALLFQRSRAVYRLNYRRDRAREIARPVVCGPSNLIISIPNRQEQSAMTTDIWQQLHKEAQQVIKREPLLDRYVYACVLNHASLESSLSFILANKLSDDVMPSVSMRELFEIAFKSSPEIIEHATCDIVAVYERDAATCSYLPVILYLKGYQAIQVHRLAHFLWQTGRKELAMFIQSRNAQVFGVDIHPACVIGRGIMLDHATGIVIGETTVIEDNVSILQQVTLGGTGNEQGDRHPKIKSGVLIAAGAKVLGNINIGEGAKIGAGSVVLADVAPHTTVVGIPAKPLGKPISEAPAETMNQNFLDDSI